ncbi:MAG: hypothetical protein KKF41_06915 [Actinobacteria bacterium]|nr:hypothetical protein [Actinomycetota bacterium]MBU2687298.1 hypothetical protein [Actinomycetota bacterium]
MGQGKRSKGGLPGRLRSAAVRKAAAKYSIAEQALRNFRSFGRLSGSAASGFPTELLPLGAQMWSGFILTPFAQQQMLGWVLPYWLRRQSVPSSGSFIPHGHFWLVSNMTHRNWTGIGLCGFAPEATVDPRGLLTPWPFSPSVDVWVLRGDELTCPSEKGAVRQGLVDDLPMVRTSFDAAGLDCTLTHFVAPLATFPVALCLARLDNPGDEPVSASLVVSVRPANPETICAINELAYDPRSRTFSADGDVLAYLPIEPDRVMVSDYAHGDVAMQLRDPRRERLPEGTTRVSEPFGLATGAAIYDLEVPAGGSASISFASPLSGGIHPPFERMLPPREPVAAVEEALEGQVSDWKELTGEGMRISVPDDVYQRAFDVNKAYLLMLFDGHTITPGVSTYHMMWFRDAAYLVPALEIIGRADMANDVLRAYPDRLTPEGFFRSHAGEWDSNGQAIWTCVHHYRMTGDTDFLKGVYPAIMKGARWLDGMRRTDLPAGNPGRGLLPPGVSAEHFGTADVFYWDDFWAVGGLRAAALAARDLCLNGDAEYLERVASEMWESLEASWDSVEKRLGRRVMPIAPGRDVDSAAVGCLAAVYPLGLMSPDEEIMANTLTELVEKCFYRDTLYHAIMHCGLNAYLSLHLAQCRLKSRDRYALRVFDSLMSMASPTMTFPEAINPLTGGGAYGDGHHGWAVADIVHFTRNLMLAEEGDRLRLLPLPKKEWLAPGNRISVDSAPTLFGLVSYTVECRAEAIEFIIEADWRDEPSALELSVPLPVVGVEVDGEAAEVKGGVITVPAAARRILLRVNR